jgi:hypothetical protein
MSKLKDAFIKSLNTVGNVAKSIPFSPGLKMAGTVLSAATTPKQTSVSPAANTSTTTFKPSVTSVGQPTTAGPTAPLPTTIKAPTTSSINNNPVAQNYISSVYNQPAQNQNFNQIQPQQNQLIQNTNQGVSQNPISNARQQYLDAYKAYTDSYKESEDLKKSKEAYLKFQTDRALKMKDIEDQTIPMNFITGQQKSIADRTAINEANLLGQIDITQNAQKATQDSLRAGVDMYGKILDMEKPVAIGGKVYQMGQDGNYQEIKQQGGVDESTASAWSNFVKNGGDISKVPDEYKNAAIQGFSGEGNNQFGARPEEQINHLNFLIKTTQDAEKYLNGVGWSNLKKTAGNLFIGDTSQKQIEQYADTIKTNLMTLSTDPAIKKFFGPQMSNADVRLMQSAPTILNPDGKPEVFKEELARVLDLFERARRAVEQGASMSSNNTGLSPDEIQYLKMKGYSDEQIKSLSFNSVGNTKVSNLPQRNQNPGNIKKGGIADSLAIGVDKQGHLIFPDAQTGFKAMAMDIQAKINGQSKYLPTNPTLAQLGKVYAEDPNWTNSVSRILGVSPTTPTKNIPINSLIQAIARQEGFYA